MQPGRAPDAGYPPVPGGRPRLRRGAAVTALVVALCGLGFAARGVLTQVMPRRFTALQQRQIQAWEIAGRWRRLPASQIFPAAVSYQLPATALDGSANLPLTARRLGIGPAVSCARGTDPAAARVLARYGCTTLLRATYTDSTGSMLVTVGVAVLPSGPAAAAAGRGLAGLPRRNEVGTVAPAAVPGTLAAGFRVTQQQLSWDTRAGSYVILAAAGYADGRPQEQVAADPYLFAEMTSLEQGLGGAVSGVLGQPPPPPACPQAPGC
jgi:hypothetical protein